jgi:hypothetical protein
MKGCAQRTEKRKKKTPTVLTNPQQTALSLSDGASQEDTLETQVGKQEARSMQSSAQRGRGAAYPS